MLFLNNQIDDLVRHLLDAIPSGTYALSIDLKKNFHAILQAYFAKMNLVTREEFDAQTAVLRRMREQLNTLEKQLADLPSSLT